MAGLVPAPAAAVPSITWDGTARSPPAPKSDLAHSPEHLGAVPNGLSAGFITAEQLGAASIRASGFKVNW
jgi:hypothetical protein